MYIFTQKLVFNFSHFEKCIFTLFFTKIRECTILTFGEKKQLFRNNNNAFFFVRFKISSLSIQ